MTTRYDQGAKTRRKVLGDAHVDRSTRRPRCMGGAVHRPDHRSRLGPCLGARARSASRERSMMTLALLAGLGNIDEFQLHLRATANTGASRGDVLEVLLHVAIYAGVPRANHAIKIAKEIFAEMEAAHD